MDPIDNPIEDAPDDLVQIFKKIGFKNTIFMMVDKIRKEIKLLFKEANSRYRDVPSAVELDTPDQYSNGEIQMYAFIDMDFRNLEFDENAKTPRSFEHEMIEILGQPEVGSTIDFNEIGTKYQFQITSNLEFNEDSVKQVEKFIDDIRYWNDQYGELKYDVIKILTRHNIIKHSHEYLDLENLKLKNFKIKIYNGEIEARSKPVDNSESLTEKLNETITKNTQFWFKIDKSRFGTMGEIVLKKDLTRLRIEEVSNLQSCLKKADELLS
jgi:hypothetical protein